MLEEGQAAVLRRARDDGAGVGVVVAGLLGGFAVAVAVTDIHRRAHDEPRRQRPELLEFVVEAVVLEVAARQGDFARQAVQRAARGEQVVVARVDGPAGLQRPGIDRPLARAAGDRQRIRARDVQVVVFARRASAGRDHRARRRLRLAVGVEDRDAVGVTQDLVAVVVRVFRAEDRRALAIAERVHQVIHDRQRREAVLRRDLVAEHADRGADAGVLRQRNSEYHFASGIASRIARGGRGRGVVVTVAQAVTDADAVVGEVRVEVGEIDAARVGVVRNCDREAVARTEEIVLLQGHAGNQAAVLRVADAEGEAAGVALLHGDHHVHLIRTARHFGRVDLDGFEIAQALQADFRAVDRRLRIPGRFELAHLAAQHFVGGAAVALEQDAAHLHARARLHDEIHRHRLVGAIDFGNRVDGGVSVAKIGQRRGDGVVGQFDQSAREDRFGPQQHQLLDVLDRQDGVAGNLGFRNLVHLAFADVGGDVHVLLAGADRDLGGFQVEIHVAAIQVEVGELLEVARQLFARVLVVAPVPGQPVGRARFPVLPHDRFAEDAVADDVDVADLGRLALGDHDLQIDAVAVERGHFRADDDAVLAAVVVLPRQFLGQAVEVERIVGFALGQANRLDAFHQVVGLDFLVALDRQGIDGRPLGHGHDQDAALAIELHIAEEAGAEQGPDGFVGLVAVELVAAFDRQVGEHGTGRDALQAVDTDVRDGEGLEVLRESLPGQGGGEGECQEAAACVVARHHRSRLVAAGPWVR